VGDCKECEHLRQVLELLIGTFDSIEAVASKAKPYIKHQMKPEKERLAEKQRLAELEKKQ
jgi:hypothetical protein